MEYKPTEKERFDYLNYGIVPVFPLTALCVKDYEGQSKQVVFEPGEEGVDALQMGGGVFRVLFTNGRTRTYSKREIVYFEQ